MKIGISSSCFYPLETERSLRRVAEAGAKTTEIFFNTPSELHGERLRELLAIRDFYGMSVSSVHPFQSFAEGYWLFSEYRRRYTDALEMYARNYPYFFSTSGASLAHYELEGGIPFICSELYAIGAQNLAWASSEMRAVSSFRPSSSFSSLDRTVSRSR